MIAAEDSILGPTQQGIVDSLDNCECGLGGLGFHATYCDKGASMKRVSESMKRDPERWIESYTARNTESVRRTVLAASNGHSIRTPNIDV